MNKQKILSLMLAVSLLVGSSSLVFAGSGGGCCPVSSGNSVGSGDADVKDAAEATD